MESLAKWLEDNGKTQQWLAEQLGCKQSSVNSMLKNGIPPERVPAISKITSLSRHSLNPDLWCAGCCC